MKITVLGSGSAFSSLNRFNSCYLVEADERRFLIDCGSDALRAIQKAGVDPFSIHEIFITHMHADHCGGLPAVLTAMHVIERTEPMRVYIPSTQVEFAKAWLANMFIYDKKMSFETVLLPLNDGKMKLTGNVELEFIRTNHLDKYLQYAKRSGIEPLSFSVVVMEGNKKFFFSSDLDSFDEAKPFINNSLSFIEATHPSLEDIANLVKKDNGSLFFTHIPQELESNGEWMKELRSKFGITGLSMVRDGQVLIV